MLLTFCNVMLVHLLYVEELLMFCHSCWTARAKFIIPYDALCFSYPSLKKTVKKDWLLIPFGNVLHFTFKLAKATALFISLSSEVACNKCWVCEHFLSLE